MCVESAYAFYEHELFVSVVCDFDEAFHFMESCLRCFSQGDLGFFQCGHWFLPRVGDCFFEPPLYPPPLSRGRISHQGG